MVPGSSDLHVLITYYIKKICFNNYFPVSISSQIIYEEMVNFD